MTIKNLNIIQFYNIYENLFKKNLPLSIAYALRYNAKVLMNAFKSFEESKKELIEKYVEKDKDNKITTDNNGNMKLKDEAIPLLNELLDIDVDETIKTFSLFDLERTECDEFDSISMNELDAIMFMIED